MKRSLLRSVMAHLGRSGGRARSPAKAAAAKRNIRGYWERVQKGEVKPPVH